MSPAFAQPLSDLTGLKTRSAVVVEGKSFEIETVSNFDIRSVSFENGNLVFDIRSSLQKNFGEMQIPQNLTKGDLRFYVDGEEIEAHVLKNDKISFVTLEFAGNGSHTLEITSDYQDAEQTQVSEIVPEEFDQLTVTVTVAAIVAVAGIGSTVFFIKKKAKQ